jgi:hypothetical protein
MRVYYRQSYQYGGFYGEIFIAAYEESRKISILKDISVVQGNEITDRRAAILKECHSKPVKRDYVVLRHELCVIVQSMANKNAEGQEYAVFDKVVKSFEVRKRLHHCYNVNFRPLDESDFYDCGLYPLFGRGLVFAYKEKRNLKYLNALLKLNDTLISLKDKLNNFELGMLSWLLSEEMRMVRAFSP